MPFGTTVSRAIAAECFRVAKKKVGSESATNHSERSSGRTFANLVCAMNETNSEKRRSEEGPSFSDIERKETPFEAVASICSVLVVGLFILTFLAQNYVIPSGSMKNTLLVGDHLLIDRITLAPSASWMPLIRYREPRRGDIVVFKKPVYQPGIDATDADGTPQCTTLVKRLIGVQGDHIHLRNGIVIVNGVAQPVGPAQPTADNFNEFLDDFPAFSPAGMPGSTESWAVNFSNHVQEGDLVVPPGMYFMMGDNRHNSLDSRFWGFVPRANIIGRPLIN